MKNEMAEPGITKNTDDRPSHMDLSGHVLKGMYYLNLANCGNCKLPGIIYAPYMEILHYCNEMCVFLKASVFLSSFQTEETWSNAMVVDLRCTWLRKLCWRALLDLLLTCGPVGLYYIYYWYVLILNLFNITLQIPFSYCHILLVAETGRIS